MRLRSYKNLSLGRGTRKSGGGGGVAAPTATATMTQISTNDTRRIYQRSTLTGGPTGKGTGTIPLTISGATAGTVNARIRDADGVTILQPEWQVGTITNGQTTLNVTGVAARLGWFFVDIRDASGWQNGTTLVGMGALFGFSGQSLVARFFGATTTNNYAVAGITPSANSSVLAHYVDTASYQPTIATMPWLTPADGAVGTGYNSAGIGEFLNRMIAMLGINCGGIGFPRGGFSLAQFITGNATWTTLSQILARAGGAFEGFFWGQGHSDLDIPTQAYMDGLTAIFNQVAAVNSFAGYGKYVWTIPTVAATGYSPWQTNNIRKAGVDWCAANGAVYVHMNDMELDGDNLHQAQPAGSVTIARHMYRATRSYYGLSSGVGPQPLTATRTAAQTIRVTLSDVGQSNLVLSGTPANRIFVFSNGRFNTMAAKNNNRFPVSSVTVVNKTTLDLTLANDPGDGHDLSVWFYWGADTIASTSDAIRDNRTDGDGLTMGRIVQANTNPLLAAKIAGSTVNAPPSGFIANASPLSMTATSATYGASAAGFGQALTGGYASGAGSRFYPRTVEAFFICPTITGANQVIMGFANSESVYVDATGRIAWGGGLGTTTLIPGKFYHVAMVHGPNGRSLYLKNLTDNTAGAREWFSATPITTPIMTGGSVVVRANNGAGALSMTGGGAVDEFAVFYGERYTGTTYTPPTTPFTGLETNLVQLHRFENDVTEALGW